MAQRGYGGTVATSAATKRHVHEGETTADRQSSYFGKWNGKGLHDWEGVQKVIVRDGYFITEVREDPATGVRRVTIGRSGVDPRTHLPVSGTSSTTVYPKDMTAAEIDAAGEQAFREAQNGAAGTVWEPYSTKRKADGSPADGFFEATVQAPKGTPIRIQGWFKEEATGDRTISSHAPRYDKRWAVVGAESW